MSPVLKAVVSGAAGAMLAEYIEPQIMKVVKPDTDFAKKAVKSGAVGLGAGATWYLLGKVA